MSYGQAFATFLGMTPPEWQVTTTEKEPADEFNWDLIGAIEAGSGGNILAELNDDFSDLFGPAIAQAPAPDIPALFEQLWPLTKAQLKQRLAELQLPAETRKALKEFILAKQQERKQKTFDETKVSEAMARNLEMARQRRPGILEARQQIRRPAFAPALAPAPAKPTLTAEEIRQEREQLAKELEEEDRRQMEKRLEEEEAKRAILRQQRLQEAEDEALEQEFLAPPPVPPSVPAPAPAPLFIPARNTESGYAARSRVYNKSFFANLPVEDFPAWKEEVTLLSSANPGTLPFEMSKLTVEEFRDWKAANPVVLRLPPSMQKWTLEYFVNKQQEAKNKQKQGLHVSKDMLKIIDYTPEQFSAAQQLGPKKRKAGSSPSSSSSSSRPRH